MKRAERKSTREALDLNREGNKTPRQTMDDRQRQDQQDHRSGQTAESRGRAQSGSRSRSEGDQAM